MSVHTTSHTYTVPWCGVDYTPFTFYFGHGHIGFGPFICVDSLWILDMVYIMCYIVLPFYLVYTTIVTRTVVPLFGCPTCSFPSATFYVYTFTTVPHTTFFHVLCYTLNHTHGDYWTILLPLVVVVPYTPHTHLHNFTRWSVRTGYTVAVIPVYRRYIHTHHSCDSLCFWLPLVFTQISFTTVRCCTVPVVGPHTALHGVIYGPHGSPHIQFGLIPVPQSRTHILHSGCVPHLHLFILWTLHTC